MRWGLLTRRQNRFSCIPAQFGKCAVTELILLEELVQLFQALELLFSNNDRADTSGISIRGREYYRPDKFGRVVCFSEHLAHTPGYAIR